jgi:MoxR-like ATPase
MDKTKKRRISSSKAKVLANEIEQIKGEIRKVFIGQENTIDSLIRALLCNGHVLVEGVPGIAKTLAIRVLAKVSGCSYKRIQFTVDLLPTDLIGLTIYNPNKGFKVVKGPVFANFIIADEINRSPPKTQSALLEAMQENQVTIGTKTYPLPNPFFVMANQNPIEHEGIYPLPEAQIDRFLFKIKIGYPEKKHEKLIMEQNITFKKLEEFKLKSVTSPSKILRMQKMTHEIYIDDRVKRYIIDIVHMTRNKTASFSDYIDLGGSPRASISLLIASKAQALIKGRGYVIPQDVRDVALDVLRHRIIPTYKARGDKIDTDQIVDKVLKSVKSE